MMIMESALAGDAPQSTNMVYFHKYYSGKINNKYAFTMDLKNLNGLLSGFYRYRGKYFDLYLLGNIHQDGSFAMKESDPNNPNSKANVFEGVLSKNEIKGTWRSVDGHKLWPFEATQTSEIIIGSKNEILTKAIGTYHLDNIDGGGGANGMWSTLKESGKWTSSTSGIAGGMRETDWIKLNQADIHLLDSMKITVGSNLTIRFYVNGKSIFDIPYHAEGMIYAIHKTDESNQSKEFYTWTTLEDDAGNQLTHFSPSTSVVNENLYLLLQDGVDYSNTIKGNFIADVSDTLLVRYSIVHDTFEVDFFSSSCCGGTTFTFHRD